VETKDVDYPDAEYRKIPIKTVPLSYNSSDTVIENYGIGMYNGLVMNDCFLKRCKMKKRNRASAAFPPLANQNRQMRQSKRQKVRQFITCNQEEGQRSPKGGN
jgi:hypothetical protein